MRQHDAVRWQFLLGRPTHQRLAIIAAVTKWPGVDQCHAKPVGDQATLHLEGTHTVHSGGRKIVEAEQVQHMLPAVDLIGDYQGVFG
ncbi:hypothetical protein D3C85_1530070 [compost metagenome]